MRFNAMAFKVRLLRLVFEMGATMFAYVGSRTTRERHARGDGISVFKCDTTTGQLSLVQVVGDLVNPSFLARNKAGDRLYVVHGDCEDISAFKIDAASGKLEFLNRQSTEGKNPVHLALDPTEKFVVVSNHITGTLVVLPMAEDGSLLPLTQKVQLAGEPGPHRKEQPFTKPHFNPFDPTGQFVLVPDKGLDKVFTFRFADGQLRAADVPDVAARETSGPRHLAFHPTKPWVYVVNELDSTVTAYHLDAKTGELKPFQIVSSLADTFTANSRSSEIEVDQAGQTVYASNRGEDSIAVFSVNPVSGRLTLIQTQAAMGRTPRFFVLDPSNRWMYVLNEDSDTIVTLGVKSQDGTLSPTQHEVSCGSPVCMVFVSA
jgi:6-phosphogluconolactonase (cycloisomerase 2 family)